MIFLMMLLCLDGSKYTAIPNELPPNYYHMIRGNIGDGIFQQQAWQYNGVTVTLDDRELPACFAADNKNNYVDLLVFKETEKGLSWTTNRVVGKVTIKFDNIKVKREYIRWSLSKVRK